MRRLEADAKRINRLCWLFQFSFGMHCALKGIVLPMIIEELSISYSMSSLVLAASTVGYAVGSVLCERAAVYIGRKQTLTIAMLILMLTSCAASLANSVWVFLIAFLISGLCYGSVECLCTAVVKRYNTVQYEKAVSRVFGGYCPGAAIGALLCAFLYKFNAGWRVCYWICAGLCLVSALLSHMIHSERENESAVAVYFFEGLRHLKAYPIFVAGCVALMIYAGAESSTFAWLTTFLTGTTELGFVKSCLLTVEMYMAIFLGRIVIPRLKLPMETKQFSVVAIITSIIVLFGISFLRNPVIICISIGIFGFAIGNMYPILISVVNDLCGDPITYSVSFLFVGMGNILGNSLVGRVADLFSLEASLWFNAGFLVLVAMMIAVILKKGSTNGKNEC